MHLLYDENGNLIAHGENGHVHEHHHEHCHGQQEGKDENLALLTYMLQHNEHHAAELEEMADKMDKGGFPAAAAEIREGVLDFHKANEHLRRALEAAFKWI